MKITVPEAIRWYEVSRHLMESALYRRAELLARAAQTHDLERRQHLEQRAQDELGLAREFEVQADELMADLEALGVVRMTIQ